MTRPVVFLGPSLPREEAAQVLDAEFLPPVRQGDVLRAMEKRPVGIAIIDGVFRNEPSVRHREILMAMAAGIPVFGAASMGAIRAAELCGHGMIGLGLIYRWYRRTPLAADDAVALQYGPAELGSPPLSDTLIDIRMSLKAAKRAGSIGADAADRLTQAARAQPFEERKLQGLGSRAGMPELDELLLQFRQAQKAKDARDLLYRMAQHAQQDLWPRSHTRRPPIAHAWLDDLRDSGLDPQQVLKKITGARG